MFIPAILALLLSNSNASERTPQVTRVLHDLAHGDAGSGPIVTPDSPVAPATRGGRELAIDFARGSRVSVGTMEIPAIGLRTAFYDGVVDEAVELGPGHWPGTPWPGRAGNSVFAGHRTTYTRPFADLDLLEPGAVIRIRVRNAPPTTYRVFKTTVVSEAKYASYVLRQPRSNSARTLTLFACTPKGSRSHRIVVQARATPIGASPTGNEKGARWMVRRSNP